MQLSIIIPLYNAEPYFRECIDSLYQQDLAEADFEVIVINDGSTDGSLALAQQLAQEHTNITVVSKQNEGQSVARNIGMDMAKGDYITFVDADDYLMPHTVAPLLQTCVSQQLDLLKTPSMGYRADGSMYRNHLDLPEDDIFKGEVCIYRGADLTSACGYFYDRKLLANSGIKFIPGIIHEDSDFIWKLMSYVQRMMISNTCFYMYRYNAQSSNRQKTEARERLSLKSDVIVAADLKAFSRAPHLSRSLRQHYARLSNAQVAGRYLSCLKGLPTKQLAKQGRTWMNEQCLFPLRGGGLTWRSTLLVQLINLLHCLFK